MANLATITNKIECGLRAVFGAGLAHCKFLFQDMSGGAVILLKRGTELPATITKDSLTALIKAGKMVILKNPFSVEGQNSEDQKETSSGGQTAVATKGLYGYIFKFINGLFFQNVLASLNSYGAWDCILIDSAGNAIYHETAGGKRKGFSLGMLNATMIDWASGSTVLKTGIEFQFINRTEMDSGLRGIDADQLDFSLLELEDVNQLEITLNAPTAAATTLTGKIVSKWDSTLTNSSLALADFVFTGVAPTAVTVAADGTLTITMPATPARVAGNVITASLKGVIESTEGQLFKSNTEKVVVIA